MGNTQERRALSNAEKAVIVLMVAEKLGFGPIAQERFKGTLYQSLQIDKDNVVESATKTCLNHAAMDIPQARQDVASAFVNVLGKRRKHPFKPHPDVLITMTPIFMARVVHEMTEARPTFREGFEYWGAQTATAIVGAERILMEDGIEKRLPIASDGLIHRGRVSNDHVIFQFGDELARLSPPRAEICTNPSVAA